MTRGANDGCSAGGGRPKKDVRAAGERAARPGPGTGAPQGVPASESFRRAPGSLLQAALAAGLGLAVLGAAQDATAQLTIKEDNQWRFALGAGASLASGNSDSRSVNVTADAVKATEYDKWTLYGRLLYGEDDNQTTSDQVSAGARYDWNLSPQWFHFGNLDGLRDRPANLEHRLSVNSGLGYHVFKRDQDFWDLFGGIGYSQDDLVQQTEVSDQQRSNYGRAELLIGQQSQHRISETATFKQRLSFFPSLEDGDSYRGVFDATLSVAINRRFDLTASLNYRYNSQPGTNLDKVDVLFVTGFTVKME